MKLSEQLSKFIGHLVLACLSQAIENACVANYRSDQCLSNENEVYRSNYKGIKLECGYRIDILVENLVVVEIKTVEALAPIHDAQLLTLSSGGRLAGGVVDQFQRCSAQGRDT